MTYQCYNFTKRLLLTKVTTAQNEVSLWYHSVSGLYFMAVIFAAPTIVPLMWFKIKLDTYMRVSKLSAL